MKTIIKIISFIILLIGFTSTMAQTPPPPNGGNSGGGTTPVGGGAPIGGGIVILVSIALAYGYARYTMKKPDYTVEEES